MYKQLLKTKIVPALLLVAIVGSAGGVATASANHDPDHQPPHGYGYTKDQCKDGGWKNFKNPDGSPMFKNQGQCVAFFSKHHGHDGQQHHHHWWQNWWNWWKSHHNHNGNNQGGNHDND